MSTSNNEIQVEQENMIETESVEKQSAKDKIMADGKMSVWKFILIARYFLPLLTTIGFVLGLVLKPNSGDFLDYFTMVLAYIGWISALTVAPLKMLKFIWTCIKFWFTLIRGFIPVYGVADLIAAFVGTAIGLSLGVVVVVFVPAVFTIFKFFEK